MSFDYSSFGPYTTQVIMSGSQLDAFFTTPFQLLSAPGANRVIYIHRVSSLFFQTGANFYGQDGGVEMCWNNTPMPNPPDTNGINPNSTTVGHPMIAAWDHWGNNSLFSADVSAGINQPLKVKANFDWNTVGQILTGHIVNQGTGYSPGVTTLGGNANLSLNITTVGGGGNITGFNTLVSTPGTLPAVGAVFGVDGGNGDATFHVDTIQPGTNGTFILTIMYYIFPTA